MAKQTINIGASPNDGTGTPLRTAFDYTNQNFTELYTATGPSGNNIVVPGNATITGDLTVRTNVISATSSGVGFGINTAAAAVDVVSSFQWRSNTGGTDKLAIFSGGAGLIYLGSTTASALSFLYNGSEAMRLNATGLGVGGSVSSKLTLTVTPATAGSDGLIISGPSSRQIIAGITGATYSYAGVGANQNLIYGGNAQLNILGDNQNVRIGTSASSYLLLDTAGNVGIGVTPSAGGSIYYKTLEIGKAGCGLFTATASLSTSELTYLSGNGVLAYNAGPEWKYGNNGAAAIYGIEDGVHKWYNATTGTAGVVFTPTQAMTLDASGNLLVGVTAAPSGTIGGSGFLADSNSRKQLHLATTASASQVLAVFINPNGTVGTIETNGSSTAYNISSDYRLKEEVKPLTGALNRITALKPSTYKWKVDGSVGEGFIAHELAEVVPFAVSGQKDAVNADGSMKTQGVDLSKIIPILVAAVQELTARVQTLETR